MTPLDLYDASRTSPGRPHDAARSLGHVTFSSRYVLVRALMHSLVHAGTLRSLLWRLFGVLQIYTSPAEETLCCLSNQRAPALSASEEWRDLRPKRKWRAIIRKDPGRLENAPDTIKGGRRQWRSQ